MKHLLRRTLVLKNSHELLAASYEFLLVAHGSLLTAQNVEECDATKAPHRFAAGNIKTKSEKNLFR
ncbi:hypothetical protein GALL_56510 [mine drainage metagenome]|uniref:Uncharacterized protein n=1 Tax=mine drainage metagenome TaxID=410659 RepID=A0A1J5SXH2_9ZZZZ